MVCCFLTGVQLPIDKALVLNRREARSLLAALNDRVASLRRVIEQLSPLDIDDDATRAAYPQRPGAAHKKHRLICKAVAEALAPALEPTRGVTASRWLHDPPKPYLRRER